MANNQQQRFSGNHMLPGVATPVGSGVWSAPRKKCDRTSISAPNRLRGHGLNAAEPVTECDGRRPVEDYRRTIT
ncbi:hypothetical protein [Acaryochloris sp. CCMEE 5410]|uniref:hypothetical protein n=1 Tax=Acaryochloris sp. CCMEE 5410 TaxID=310037 RepID=UPI0021D06167|nr:hypothetical protein [Acaryochloris sp. CCMEE 5410]